MAREALKEMMFGSAVPASRIGRYRVTRVVGEGGMGVVYAGHDDALDRKVALKLLRNGGEQGQARLQREAQALAKLSHPNVVQIHEVGEHEGSVFVAMEFVEGSTLRAWLAEDERRAWRDVLARLCEAGRGLAAAHAVALVHRDFKPENVMVGSDGRVRVLDFGLVRASRDEAEPSEPVAFGHDPPVLGRALTLVGTVLGTPSYMAPEQLANARVDAAADQFSFSVVCFEALYGARPFRGDSLGQLHESVAGGRITIPPTRRKLPDALWNALVRGLAPDPAERWPDLGALLERLERIARPRHTTLLAGAGVALAVGTAFGVSHGMGTPPPCDVSGALAGTWDGERRVAVGRAFAASRLPFAPVTADAVASELDAWADRWLDARGRTCRATKVEKVATESTLVVRNQCSRRHRLRFEGLVRVLEGGTPDALGSAWSLLETLPDPRDCETMVAKDAGVVEARPEVDAAFGRLGEGEAMNVAGRFSEAASIAQEAARVGVAFGDRELALRGQALLARVRVRSGALDLGARELLAVVREAQREGLDLLVAELSTTLAVAVAGQWSKPEAEALLVDEAAAWSTRAGLEDARWAHDIARARVELELGKGDAPAAMAQFAALERSSDRVSDVILEGRVHAAMGDHERADRTFERAKAKAVAKWGERSWLVAACDHNLGLSALERGDFERAADLLASARVDYARIVGADSADVARVRFAEASIALATGDIEGAKKGLAAVLPAYAQHFGPSHALTGEVHNAMGIALFHQGDYQGSVDAYRLALAIARETRGPSSSDIGLLLANLGESLLALGDLDAAMRSYEEASAIFAVTLAPDDDLHALVLKGRALTMLAQGTPTPAIALLDQALSLMGEGGSDPYERADLHRTMARALSMAGANPQRAREHAVLAAEGFRALGMEDEISTIEPISTPKGRR